MKRLDLIIDALSDICEDVNCQCSIAEALAVARSLRELEPMCWITPHGEGFRMRFDPPVNDVPMGWTKLYALGDEK